MPFIVYKRGGVYHYRGSIGGKRFRGSARTDSRRAAEAIASEREHAARNGRPSATKALTFANAVNLYLDAQKPLRFIAAVAKYWGDRPLEGIKPGHVRQCALDLYPTQSAATRNRQAIVPTLAIINHAAELGKCHRIKIKRFPVDKKERRAATWAWVTAFMSVASPHLGALACFMLLTGARISEAIGLTWTQVRLTESKALIRSGKTKTERWAHLPPPLVAAMANIGTEPNPFNSKPDSGRVFGYTSRSTAKVMWNKAVAKAGIEHLSFHACRHGFATSLLHLGVDPVTVAKLGGWKSPAHVFATYGHPQEDTTLADRITGTKTGTVASKRLKKKV